MKKLEDNALFATKATKVVIPKSVREIGSCALTGKDIEKIELKKEIKCIKWMEVVFIINRIKVWQQY